MEPITRSEIFMAKAAGDFSGNLPTPITRAEQYWAKIIKQINAGSSVPPEEINAAIEDYINTHSTDIVTETQLSSALAGYVAKDGDKTLTDINYSTTERAKVTAADEAKHTHSNKTALDGITAASIQQWNSAQPNVNADWNSESGDAQILNKPDLPDMNDYYDKTEIDLMMTEAPLVDIQTAVDNYFGLHGYFLDRVVEKSAAKSSDVFALSEQKGFLSYSDGHFISDNGYNVYIFDVSEDTSVTLTKNAGGLLGAAVYSEHLDEIPTSASAASTYFVRGGRSNNTEYPLPAEGTEWMLSAGQMLAIFEQEVQNTEFTLTYTAREGKKLSNDIHFNTSHIAEIKVVVDNYLDENGISSLTQAEIEEVLNG